MHQYYHEPAYEAECGHSFDDDTYNDIEEIIAKDLKDNNTDTAGKVDQDIHQNINQDCSFDSSSDDGYKTLDNSPGTNGNGSLFTIEQSETQHLAIQTGSVQSQIAQAGSSSQFLVCTVTSPYLAAQAVSILNQAGPHLAAQEGSDPQLAPPEGSGLHLVAQGGSGPHLATQEGTDPQLAPPEESGLHLAAQGGSGPHLAAQGGSGPHLVAQVVSSSYQAAQAGPRLLQSAPEGSSLIVSGSPASSPGTSRSSGAKNMPKSGSTNPKKGKALRFNQPSHKNYGVNLNKKDLAKELKKVDLKNALSEAQNKIASKRYREKIKKENKEKGEELESLLKVNLSLKQKLETMQDELNTLFAIFQQYLNKKYPVETHFF